MPTKPSLIAKLNNLQIERLNEVEDFVDFLCARDQDRAPFRAAVAASEPVFAAVWSNPEDDVYDTL